MTQGGGEWLVGSMNRVIADMNDAGDAALRMVNFGRNAMAALLRQRTEGTVPRTTVPRASGAHRE